MTDIDVSKLREVAGKATSGPWAAAHNSWDEPVIVSPSEFGPCETDMLGHEPNHHYLATFDPPTVLAMLDRLERAEAAVERVRAVLATVGALRDSGRYPESANGWLDAITGDVGAALEEQR